MRFEDLRPIKVLSEEEFKKEFNRINQIDVLKVTASGVGVMALYKLLKLSPLIDAGAKTLFNEISMNATTAYSTVSTNMAKRTVLPYVLSISNLHICIGVGLLLGLMCLYVIGKEKAEGKGLAEALTDCALVVSPVVLWILMEVIF